MKFYNIDKLERDTYQDNLYDFFKVTFDQSTRPTTPFQSTVVLEEQYMRLDLVSQQVYGNDSYVDFLCDFNYIDNPLNIMGTDELNYPSIDGVNSYRNPEADKKTIPGILLDSEKSTKVDENRKKYVEQNYSLTPTSIEVPKEPVQVKKGNIVIGD